MMKHQSHFALTIALCTCIPSLPTAMVHAAAAPPHLSMVVGHNMLCTSLVPESFCCPSLHEV